MTPSAPHRGPIDRLETAVVRVNQALIVALMATMAVLVFVNVVTRYLFSHSIIWVEELTQYQMIWVAYLGAGLALREGRHVSVDTLQDLLPSPGTTLGRYRTVASQVPVRVGGVLVHPGDLIVGDVDGVVVVPHARAEEVLKLAQEIDARELEQARLIIAEKSLRKGLAKYGRI